MLGYLKSYVTGQLFFGGCQMDKRTISGVFVIGFFYSLGIEP